MEWLLNLAPSPGTTAAALERKAAAGPKASRDSRTDDVVFDKADAAESLEKMRESLEKIDDEIDALKKTLDKAEGGPEQAALEAALATLESRKKALSV